MLDEQIIKLLNEFDKYKYDYDIWIVANVLDTVQNYESFVNHTNFSEFFTKAEFASIYSAIVSVFGYVRTFYSEIEFIEHVIKNKNTDFSKVIVFNLARDGVGEGKKSLVPSFCNLLSIKYTGSNPFVMSLLRNKFIYSKYLESMGIKIPQTLLFSNGKLNITNDFIIPKSLIVKNNCEAASVGLTEKNIINFDGNPKHLVTAAETLSKEMKSSHLLLQEYIDGSECEVLVIKINERYYAFSPIELLIRNSKIITDSVSNAYDYTFQELQEKKSINICTNIKNTTEKAAELLNIDDYARFDFRIDSNGEIYLIDIAGTPYLTRHSSVAYLFTNVLHLEYNNIFKLIIAASLSNQSNVVNCKSESSSPLD